MTNRNGVTANSFTNSFHKEIGERVGCHPIYVELHARSTFTFLEGSSTTDELLAPAVELKQLNGVFGANDLYVELQRHYNRMEEARNQALIDLARSHQLPLLATNGVNHAHAQAREALDVLTCVRHKVKIHEAGRLLSINS